MPKILFASSIGKSKKQEKPALKELIPGLTLIMVRDPEKLFSLAVSETPDVILIDFKPSGNDFKSFISGLKSANLDTAVPIAILAEDSASFNNGEFPDSLSFSIIRKPLEDTELAARLIILLQAAETGRKIASEKNEALRETLQRSRDLLIANQNLENQVSELKKTQETLFESVEKYRALIEQASDGIFISDAKGNYIDVNQSGCDMLGYSRDELLSLNIKDLIPPEELKEKPIPFSELKNGSIIRTERNLLRKDGTAVPVEISARIISGGRLQGIVRDISERKSSHEFLRRSEQRFKNILQTANDGFFTMNSKGELLSANDAACRILGYSFEKMKGMNINDIDVNENPEETQKHILNVIEKGSDIFETRHKRTDGEIINVEISTTWQKEENTFFAFMRDITGWKKAQSELLESEKKYRNLFEKSKDAILILENGKFVDCNQATVDMLGYEDKSQILETHPSQLSPPKQSDGRNSSEKADEMIRIAVEKGSHRFEWNHVRSDGVIFPVEVLLTQISTEEGREVIHTVWRDISERNRANELQSVIFQISQAVHTEETLSGFLKEVHMHLGKILDTTNFYVAIYNQDTDKYSFPYYKDEFDNISEFETLQLHLSLTDYVRRKGIPLFADRNTTDELFKQGEIKLIGSDSPIWIGAPLRVSQKVIGVVAVQDYHDSAKYSEKELELLSFVSDNIASAIGKKMADEALQKSELELKKLNTDKDKLFSIIAHDLRAPFNSLLGSTGFLAREVDDLSKTEIKEFADSINKAATNVFRLIENLLQWSRFQTGRIHYSPVEYFLKDQVDDVLELFSVNAIRKKIIFNNGLSGNTKIFADKDMIEIVLRNLFSNALKYTERGGSIEITSAEKNNFIEITIVDTGVGMPGDKIGQLFDPGKMHSMPGTENEKGSGLGLLLCKDFIQMNKGTIKAESSPGKGSRFTFSVPKSEPD